MTTTVFKNSAHRWAETVSTIEAEADDLAASCDAAESEATEAACDPVTYKKAAAHAATVKANLAAKREQLARARRAYTEAQLRELDADITGAEEEFNRCSRAEDEIKGKIGGQIDRLNKTCQDHITALQTTEREATAALNTASAWIDELRGRRERLMRESEESPKD